MAQLIKLIQENKKLKNTLKQYQEVYGCCPHLDDSLIKGGFRVVRNIKERDEIPCCYRKKGMTVLVINDTVDYTEYVLKTDSCNKNIWEKKQSSGTSGANWGEIFGKIENQTDLMNLLNSKAELSDIPPQINLIEGTNIEITGTYPNITISANVESMEWSQADW